VQRVGTSRSQRGKVGGQLTEAGIDRRAAENRTGGELRRSTATWAGVEEGGRGEVPGGRVKLLRDPVEARVQGSGAPAAAKLCPERRRGGGAIRVCWRLRFGNGSRGGRRG
jgi:hypothetical protein